jgi:hypothetical protein
MSDLGVEKEVRYWSKGFAPVLIVLCLNVLLALLIPNFSLVKGWEAVYKVLTRFFRFALLLSLPLYVLLPMYGFFVRRMSRALIQIERRREPNVHPLKHWVFRPLQGIGIGLLFETKLLAVLQVIAGVTARPFLFFPQGQSEPGRLLVVGGITVVISLFLSFLWTLDDMGIRYVNRKDQEMKMIGKFIGMLMPVLFGFYGIFSLVASHPKGQAAFNLLKIVVILYPPFTVFSVFHNYFLKSKEDDFFKKASLENGGIWEKKDKPPYEKERTL